MTGAGLEMANLDDVILEELPVSYTWETPCCAHTVAGQNPA